MNNEGEIEDEIIESDEEISPKKKKKTRGRFKIVKELNTDKGQAIAKTTGFLAKDKKKTMKNFFKGFFGGRSKNARS